MLSSSAIFLIAVVGVLVIVVALFLIRVHIILHHVVEILSLVTFGVRSIAHRTEAINPVVTDINKNLSAVAGGLDEALAKASRPH